MRLQFQDDRTLAVELEDMTPAEELELNSKLVTMGFKNWKKAGLAFDQEDNMVGRIEVPSYHWN